MGDSHIKGPLNMKLETYLMGGMKNLGGNFWVEFNWFTKESQRPLCYSFKDKLNNNIMGSALLNHFSTCLNRSKHVQNMLGRAFFVLNISFLHFL